MLSIIICSISPERLQNIKQNIEDTIGVDYELIAIDNRVNNWPIARVYNEGARQARYPYLFFVHEDVIFHNSGWGKAIEEKLDEPDCGVIGFAGSKVMTDCYSGWGQYNYHWHSAYYFFANDGVTVDLEAYNVKLKEPYDPVVVVDGFAFFVRRDVWAQCPFDEALLTGFHCYDIDFSLQVGQKYRNYVCGLDIKIEHLSAGNFSSAWVLDTIRLYDNKWKQMLPLKTDDVRMSSKAYRKNKEELCYRFLFKALRTDVPRKLKKQLLNSFWQRPFTWRHFTHCLSCTLKYLRS